MDDAFTRKAFVLIGGLVAKRFFVSGCMRRRLASIEPENVLATGREVDPPAGAVFRRRGKIRSARSGSFVRCGVLSIDHLSQIFRPSTPATMIAVLTILLFARGATAWTRLVPRSPGFMSPLPRLAAMKQGTVVSTFEEAKNLRSDAVAPRMRFAPSPTGSLHVGGARTALCVCCVRQAW